MKRLTLTIVGALPGTIHELLAPDGTVARTVLQPGEPGAVTLAALVSHQDGCHYRARHPSPQMFATGRQFEISVKEMCKFSQYEFAQWEPDGQSALVVQVAVDVCEAHSMEAT